MSLNPQFSFRAPTFRSQARRVYETIEVRSEMKETPEDYRWHVYIPGFTKDRIKITLLDSSRMVNIKGERPTAVNKWRSFDQTYPIPENSEAETLEANFEQGTLILKIQKKLSSHSQQQVEQSPQDPSNNKALDEAKPEKLQEKDNMKSDSPQTQSFEKKIQNVTHDDTLSQIPQDTISNNNNNPQTDQPEFEPKPTVIEKTKTQIDEKLEKGQEELEPKTTIIEKTNTLTNEKPQKGQAEFQPKPTTIEKSKTQIDAKLEKGQEEFEPKITTIEKSNTLTNEKPQKVQEELESKPTSIETIKAQIEEKIVGMRDAKDSEKERITKKEVKEKIEMPYESSKTIKDVKNHNLTEKEIENRELFAPENEKELSCGRTSHNEEGKNGIRKIAAASSQFITRIAEGKWRGEERHLVENIGAAVLVIAAFGAYVSYRLSS